MLKWAKGSKDGGLRSGHHGSAPRVSLADLRRASAKLLRRKSGTKTTMIPPSPRPAAAASPAIPQQDGDSPPPLVPPRGSSATPLMGQQGVIKQATVRRMSTLRQTSSASSPARVKRPGSSSSTCSSNGSGLSSPREIIQERRANKTKPAVMPDGDNSSSLYMQLDHIPVAVQQCVNKRKALEDISNQAYRHIIRSLQEELAQLADDETRTLAEATLLPVSNSRNDA